MAAEPSERPLRRPLAVAATLTVVLGLALTLGWEPGIPGEWVWRSSTLPARLWPAAPPAVALVALAAFVCSAGRWQGLQRRARLLTLLALVICAFALQCAFMNAVGLAWAAPGAVIASPPATTYFAVSLDVTDVGDWIAHYPERMGELPHHAATHPPGLVLFFLLIRRASGAVVREPGSWLVAVAEHYKVFGIDPSPQDAAAAIASALALSLIGALGLVPLYLLVKQIAGDRPALCATFLAAGMPALLLLGASSDLLVMTLAILTLALGGVSWRRRSVVWSLLAGFTLALGMFFSLAVALVAVWAGVWVLLAVLGSSDRRPLWRPALQAALSAAAGFALFYAGMYWVWGYRPVAVVREALDAHRHVTTISSARTYWKWIIMNPVECAIFAGIPITVLCVRGWRDTLRSPDFGRLRPFLLAWLIVVVVLILSGTVRGEVGRIWLFLIWPVSVVAGGWLCSRSAQAGTVIWVLFLQIAQAILMRAHLTIYDIL